MLDFLPDLALFSFLHTAQANSDSSTPPSQIQATVPTCPPDYASGSISEAFFSYAFEFSSFPDFTGNDSVGRNELSYTLISNIGDIQGAMPYVRSGGNTLDYSWYNETLDTSIIGIYTNASANFPTLVTIGPSYYEGYTQWPGVKFVNDFNQAHQGDVGRQNSLDTVGPACRALSSGNLQYWEYGNEADIYNATNIPARPDSYTVQDYVAEWINGTRAIKAKMMEECPDLVTDDQFKFIAPSFAVLDKFDAVEAVRAGLDQDNLIAEWSMHSYMGGNGDPGNTLPGTLMNHTHVKEVLDGHANLSRALHQEKDVPYAITEVNSLSGFGQPDISNVLGSALWTMDYQLYAASTGAIQRVHMQQGTNARYASWQPLDTDEAKKGTNPPYYGDVAVATSLGKSGQHDTKVAMISESDETNVGYAIYEDDKLARITIINFNPYNESQSHSADGSDRPVKSWQLNAEGCWGDVQVQRLSGPGSDAKKGITFDGYSYEYEIDGGRPVKMDNVTSGETLQVKDDGTVCVDVPDSSAAVLSLCCGK